MLHLSAGGHVGHLAFLWETCSKSRDFFDLSTTIYQRDYRDYTTFNPIKQSVISKLYIMKQHSVLT